MEKVLKNMRTDYILGALNKSDVASNPIDQFKVWLNQAIEASAIEPTAFTLATVSRDNMPSARILLLKDVTDGGFTFFSNYQSRKGRHLDQAPKAAMLFFWPELQRQVRIEGSVRKTHPQVSDEYFNSRPPYFNISACISPQSREIPNRDHLVALQQEFEANASIDTLRRPSNWGGYTLSPDLIEFWQGRSGRLHDRLQYTVAQGRWKIDRLAP